MILVLLYLFIMSIYNTCYLNSGEHVFYLSNSLSLGIVITFIIVFALIGFVIYKNKFKICDFIVKYYKYIILFLMAILIIQSIVFILKTQLHPRADSDNCLSAAVKLLHGDYSEWDKGTYCYMYPNQNGLILFESAVISILGKLDIVAFQVLNVFALVGFVLCILDISNILWENGKIQKVFLIASYTFYYPLILYVTFIYGTIYGLFFMMLSIRFVLKYLKNHSIKDMIISIVSICLSCFFKMNYKIALIAILLVFIYDLIFKKNKLSFVSVILLVVCFLEMSFGINKIIEGIIGQQVAKGIPTLAWVEMGLQEGPMANGWYNLYNVNVMNNNDYDSEKANLAIKADLSNTVNNFVANKKYAILFFQKKITSQWCEPTFESLWIQDNRESNLLSKPSVINSLIFSTGKLHKLYIEVFKIIQIFIYLLSMLYFIVNFKSKEVNHLILPIIFIGGFIFHIFWEGKSQYTIVYFICLIPYAIQAVKYITTKIKEGNNRKYYLNNRYFKIIFVLITILIVIKILPTNISKFIILGNESNDYYESIYSEK